MHRLTVGVPPALASAPTSLMRNSLVRSGASDGEDRAAPQGAGRPLGPVLALIPSTPLPPDRCCIERIRGGDAEAFGAVFRALYPSLCSLVARRVGSPEIAEELVQDVLVRVWERRAELDPGRSLTRYLYRAAKNRALNHLKHRVFVGRSQELLRMGPRPLQPTPEDQVRYNELLDATEEAIEQLPDRCREIFLLSRQGDLRYLEISRLLGISVKTVETQMGRALKALRSALLPYL